MKGEQMEDWQRELRKYRFRRFIRRTLQMTMWYYIIFWLTLPLLVPLTEPVTEGKLIRHIAESGAIVTAWVVWRWNAWMT